MHYEVYGKGGGGGAARSGAGMDSGSSVASSQDYSRSPYRREPAFVPYVSGGDAASVGSYSSYASSRYSARGPVAVNNSAPRRLTFNRNARPQDAAPSDVEMPTLGQSTLRSASAAAAARPSTKGAQHHQGGAATFSALHSPTLADVRRSPAAAADNASVYSEADSYTEASAAAPATRMSRRL